MPKNCDTCKYDLFRLCGEEDKTPCDDCYNGNPPTKWEPGENYEPKTNADRIRAMSDEELAKECVRQFPMYLWPTEVRTIYFDFENHNKNEAINAWLQWLREPAEGE